MLKRIIKHYKHNPEGYWFKRNIFGWGWVPVRWQGLLVTLLSIALIAAGIYLGEAYDAPGLMLFGILLGALLTLGFGNKKGEKVCVHWQELLKDEVKIESLRDE